MKRILIDAGNFYTKVYVMSRSSENCGEQGEDSGYQFYGRSFFPTLAGRAGDTSKNRIYYEHDGSLYEIGYDCSSSLKLDGIIEAFEKGDSSTDSLRLMIKKAIFDHADSGDLLKIELVVDCPQKAAAAEEIAGEMDNREVVVAGFRGYDGRRIEKRAKISVGMFPSGYAIEGYLDRKEFDFGTALVVDAGYRKTKVYVVDCERGVELFRIEDFGVAQYYEKMVQLFAEEKIEDNHFLWLVKQVELGCDEVEVRSTEEPVMRRRVFAVRESDPMYYDVSLVMDNVRWDLNKEFKRMVKEIFTSYYTNRVEWTDLMVVTGGGASLSGDILRLSLEDDGYFFNDLYIEKQPIYTVLEGACHSLHAPYPE